ncbi:MAG: beta-lactamase family protein, partial [Proteobacteria bacterium]|nr:beta-lactamase family protein [Pseudomonadota bacterium]
MNAPSASRWASKAIAILLLFLLASCGSTASSPTYDAAIQEGRTAAQAIIDQGGASAITMALVDANRIIWSQSFGLADREAGLAPTPSTTFGIGSVSKMFAAVAVMKLVDRGIINLDVPLVTYLPSFRMASAGYENITARMLLNHSSGFPGTDYHNAESYSPMPGYLNQVLQALSTARFKAPPGYMSVYCNDGFTVTEALIQATTGKSYTQFVQEEILTPLGMANTRFTRSAFPAGSYATTYADGVAQPQEFVSVYASGGVHSTANDMG